MEVERKWLVATPPAEAMAAPGEAIDQGYLVIGEGGSEARVRRAGERLSLTVKSGAGLVRAEVEIELSAEQFDALWPATAGRRLRKTRRRLDGAGAVIELDGEAGAVIELDVYAGPLEGLIVAEVEFADEAAARAFRAPAWLGGEVTEDDAYKNRRLAVDGRPPVN
jgi:CYTH domain-containing protein